MIANETDLVRWSRRQWAGTVLLILVVQIVLVVGLSDRSRRAVRSASISSEWNLTESFTALDPLLDFELQSQLFFTEPSVIGFSGEAWLHKKEQRYLTVTNRTSPEMMHFAEARKLFPNDLTQLLQPPPARKGMGVNQMTGPALLGGVTSPASRLELEGFNGRQLRKQPVLNVQFHSDVLNATIVQTGLAADGFPRVTRVLQTSGSRAADNEAIAVAKGLRFTPLPLSESSSENLDWGKLIFYWHTLELTNKTSATR